MRAFRLTLILLFAPLLAGCLTDSTGVNRTSSLRVITDTTDDSNNVPLVYEVEVGDFPPLQIGPDDRFLFEAIPVGNVQASLSVPQNCQVQAPNPRTVEIVAGLIAETTFTVACS